MMVTALQIAAVLAIALYLVLWQRSVRRRNAQSWESLLARLRPEWSARELSEQFLWKEGLSATPEDAWQRMEGPRGLWVMYQNARVMLEMADYRIAGTARASIVCFLRPCAATPCRFAFAC